MVIPIIKINISKYTTTVEVQIYLISKGEQ